MTCDFYNTGVMPDTRATRAGTGARLFVFAGALLFVSSLVYAIASYVSVFGRTAPGMSGMSAAVNGVVDVALFTAFALHHSLFARANIKTLVTRVVPPHLERSVYVWIASAMFIAVCRWWQPVAGEFWAIGPPWAYGLAGIQIAGLAITLAASRQLDVFSLAGIRQALGGGPRPAAGLIHAGLFALVRHPIYFGWVLMVWPTPHMTGTRLVFATISTVYLAAAIPFEERSLRRDFGGDYDAYARRVKWKMVPFVY